MTESYFEFHAQLMGFDFYKNDKFIPIFILYNNNYQVGKLLANKYKNIQFRIKL